MKRASPITTVIRCLAMVALLSAPCASAEGPTLVDPAGPSIQWPQWLAENGTCAVLVWASWVPDAERAIAELPAIASLCTDQELRFILIDVQETIADARPHLQQRGVRWLHDRHGAILKHHRVTWVPQLLIVDREGRVLDRLQPTAEAVRGWRHP